jgi:glycosyltransferase involved in cell wall biosynthesis
MVPRRDPAALADALVRLASDPGARERLGAHARRTGAAYDIDRFVRKMERLYTLLHETSRRTKRAGVLTEDLSFLAEGAIR